MLNVIYLNRVQTIIVYAKYLEECGYKTFIMSSENKNSDEFLKVLNTKRFPEDVNVILTTAVFSEGIDIEDERGNRHSKKRKKTAFYAPTRTSFANEVYWLNYFSHYYAHIG